MLKRKIQQVVRLVKKLIREKKAEKEERILIKRYVQEDEIVLVNLFNENGGMKDEN